MRTKTSLMFVLSALTLAACGDTSTATSTSYNRNVTVVNNSGYTVTQFYGSNSGASTWQEDILGADVLPPGGSVNINFDDGSGYCTFDFKAVFADGTSTTENGIDVCATSTVTIN
jgi:ABC-type glycerol-3-phosphate transport system substrate-binding protein